MGGCGSGGSRGGRNRIIEDSSALRVSRLKTCGAFDGDGGTGWIRGGGGGAIRWVSDTVAQRLTLGYAATRDPRAEPTRYIDRFELSVTVPRFGGRRWWIVCACGRRVSALWRPAGELRLRCRRCYSLNYQSQHESGEWRAYRRAKRVLARVSPMTALFLVPADLLDSPDLPPRPKNMRRRTHRRLVVEWEHWSAQYSRHVARGIGQFIARVRTGAG
jgi:hypothetical protein